MIVSPVETLPKTVSDDGDGEKCGGPGGIMESARPKTPFRAEILQSAIFSSANCFSIATDARGVIPCGSWSTRRHPVERSNRDLAALNEELNAFGHFAEGVETEEQSRLLLLLNCDEMQGFLFSKPVPSELFEATFLARPSGG